MNYIFLIIGTVLAILFILAMFLGGKYDDMLGDDVELDFDTYPGKSIYSAGLWLAHTPLLAMPSGVNAYLLRDTQRYYKEEFGPFYAHIIWAQVISYTLLVLAVTFLAAGIVGPDMRLQVVLLGAAVCAVLDVYFYTRIHVRMQDRREACESEFPNMISKLALMLNSGMTIVEAWNHVAKSKEGVIYDMMREAGKEMTNAVPPHLAIYRFGVRCDSEEIRKFTTAMGVSIEEGPSQLRRFLLEKTAELWEARRQNLLQKGEVAASKLIMPIAIMFGGVMLIIGVAAMQSFSF